MRLSLPHWWLRKKTKLCFARNVSYISFPSEKHSCLSLHGRQSCCLPDEVSGGPDNRSISDAGTTQGSCTHGQQSFSWLLPPSTAFSPAGCRAEGAARKSTRQSGDRTNQLPVWTLSLSPGHSPSQIPVHSVPAFPHSSERNDFIPMHGNSWAVSCCCTAFCCIWSGSESHPPEDTRASTRNVTTFGTRVFVCTIELRQDDSRPEV